MRTLTNIQHLPEYSGIKEAPQTALQVDEKMTEHDVTEHDADDKVNKHSLWGISLILLGERELIGILVFSPTLYYVQ